MRSQVTFTKACIFQGSKRKEIYVHINGERVGYLYRDESMKGWAVSTNIEKTLGISSTDRQQINNLKWEIRETVLMHDIIKEMENALPPTATNFERKMQDQAITGVVLTMRERMRERRGYPTEVDILLEQILGR